jgi:uncharacterized protein (DUF305 family)
MNRATRPLGLALLALTTVAACRTTPAAHGADVRPTSAPPTTSTPVAASATTPAPSPGAGRVAEADVRFVQRMIGHHAQALTITALVSTRSRRTELRALAERIDATQREEMTLMRRWLAARGQAMPATDAHEGHAADDHAAAGHAAMPGMLTPDELTRLEQAAGPAFDRLFLEGMIRHHEGALTMVQELFATPGAAQDTEVFRLASDVDADQRAEIRRMRALLPTTTSTPAP